MREKIVRVLRIISYSLAAFGAAWFGQTLENVAALSAAGVAVFHFPRREYVYKYGSGSGASKESTGEDGQCVQAGCYGGRTNKSPRAKVQY